MASTTNHSEFKTCIRNNNEHFKAWLEDSKEKFYQGMGNLMGNHYFSDDGFLNKWKSALHRDKANIEALNKSTTEWKRARNRSKRHIARL